MDADGSVQAVVLDILSEVVGETVQVLRAHPVLATHDWDSLASLEALAQLESRFGVVLDLRDYNAARLVGDLVALVVAARTGTNVSTT